MTEYEERLDRELQSHEKVHALEKEAIDALAALVAAQRMEDAHAVEIALSVVKEAALLHAAAHSEQHAAHLQIHEVEKEAVIKATEQMDRRLEGMNEFRNTLRDQAATFVSRDLYDAKHEDLRKGLEIQIANLESRLGLLISRLDVTTGVQQGANVERRLQNISAQLEGNSREIIKSGGQRQGASATIGYFIAAATLLLAATGVIVSIVLTR